MPAHLVDGPARAIKTHPHAGHVPQTNSYTRGTFNWKSIKDMVTDLTVVGLHVDSGINSALHLQMMDDVPEVNSWPSSASPNRTT